MDQDKAKTRSKHLARSVRIKASDAWWEKVRRLMAVNGHATHSECFRAVMNNAIDRTDLSQG